LYLAWEATSRDLFAPRAAGLGPGLPTLAAAQVVGYPGYTGRRANVAATAAHDPKLS